MLRGTEPNDIPVRDPYATQAVAAPRRRGGIGSGIVGALIAFTIVGAGVSGVVAGRVWSTAQPATLTTMVKPGAPVVVSIRDLARLESAEYRMERVIDIRDKQKTVFGLLDSEDTILMVVSARVQAGVDLHELTPRDVEVDAEDNRVTITLPAAKIFGAALDGERTYVHSRDTDLLAKPSKTLESRARRHAEKELVDAAKQAGILDRASANARQTIETLVRSLGYQHVEVRVRS